MPTPNVNPAAPQTEAPLSTVADGPAKCDECDAPALFAYAWPWGEGGKVCATHAALKQQTAENLGRTITLAALPPPQNVPLTRSERSALKGEVYALEEEAKDLKQRGLALYNENGQLTQQLQALTVRQRETAAQLADKTAEAEELTRRLEERDAEHGEMWDELQRLRTLQKFQQQPADATATERGLPSSSVVEGS
jgi:DNA repair exonuclease SbcCD ATPase subunit